MLPLIRKNKLDVLYLKNREISKNYINMNVFKHGDVLILVLILYFLVYNFSILEFSHLFAEILLNNY
jgi:hypothetical protein